MNNSTVIIVENTSFHPFPQDRDLPSIRGPFPGARDIGEVDVTRSPYIVQPQFEMYDNDKTFFYYFFNVLCVVTIIFSLTMNCVLLYLIKRRWNALMKRPFFKLLVIFCCTNVVCGLCSVILEIPVVTFLSSASITSYTFTTFYQIFYHIQLVEEQMIQYLHFQIGLLRFIVFVLPNLETKIFSNNMVCLHFFLSLLASIILVSYMYTFGCYFRYEVPADFFNFACSNLNIIDAGPILIWYDITLIHLPILTFILYIAILFKIFIQRKVARSRKVEIMLFAQSLFLFVSFEISGILTIYVFTFPNIDRTLAYNVRRILNTTYTLAAGLSPLFVLLTSVEIEKSIKTVKITKITNTRPGSSINSSSRQNSVTPSN